MCLMLLSVCLCVCFVFLLPFPHCSDSHSESPLVRTPESTLGINVERISTLDGSCLWLMFPFPHRGAKTKNQV
jgi:hypothetical protein